MLIRFGTLQNKPVQFGSSSNGNNSGNSLPDDVIHSLLRGGPGIGDLFRRARTEAAPTELTPIGDVLGRAHSDMVAFDETEWMSAEDERGPNLQKPARSSWPQWKPTHPDDDMGDGWEHHG
jgi:hypothetical protein